MRDLVIFFLAHNGVSQFELWRHWASLSTHTNIHLRILTTQQQQTRIPVQYFISKQNNQKVYIGETRWADFSIVRETIKGYFYIAQESIKKGWRDDTLVLLVSGTDIPIIHPDKISQERSKDLVCYTNVENGVFYHSQFIGLTIHTIKHKLLTEIGIDLSKPFDQEKVYVWWLTILHVLIDYKDKMTLVPDMIFLNGILSIEQVGQRHCTTISFIHHQGLNSPITWKSFRNKQIVWFEVLKTKQFTIKVSFEEMMYICQYIRKKQPYVFFFRKVSSNFQIPIDFMTQIWEEKTPPFTFNDLIRNNIYIESLQQLQEMQHIKSEQQKQLEKSAIRQISRLDRV